MDFFVICNPPKTTSQQKRAVVVHGKPRFFKGKKQKAAESTFETLLLPHQPPKPLCGAVSLTIEATWPWRASDLGTKAKREYAEKVGRIPHLQKPDCDNFAKMLTDSLSSLRFIEDDKAVCELIVRKYFGSNPGIRVRLIASGEGESLEDK